LGEEAMDDNEDELLREVGSRTMRPTLWGTYSSYSSRRQ
jgi:hypothetical protein